MRYLDPVDAAQIRLCQEYVLRVEDKNTGWQHMDARRCKNPYCPYCGVFNHRARAYYHARKLASVNPDPNPQPRVVNLVFELPVPFHGLVRSHPGPPASRVASGHPAHHRGRLSLRGHPQGQRRGGLLARNGRPVQLPRHRGQGHALAQVVPPLRPHPPSLHPPRGRIKPLRKTWPERYTQTNARYRACLRAALLPLVQKGPLLSVELQAFLASDFDTIWHVSKPPKARGSRIIHGTESAMHRIWYSCRPLVQLDRAQLVQEEGGKDVLLYEPPASRGKPILHRIPAGPAFGQIRSLHPFLFGTHARTQAGLFGNRVYPTVAKLAGHPPVYERDKKNRRIVAAYGPDHAGRMVQVDPRTLRPTLPTRKETSA